jgi:hypothetical protein
MSEEFGSIGGDQPDVWGFDKAVEYSGLWPRTARLLARQVRSFSVEKRSEARLALSGMKPTNPDDINLHKFTLFLLGLPDVEVDKLIEVIPQVES